MGNEFGFDDNFLWVIQLSWITVEQECVKFGRKFAVSIVIELGPEYVCMWFNSKCIGAALKSERVPSRVVSPVIIPVRNTQERWMLGSGKVLYLGMYYWSVEGDVSPAGDMCGWWNAQLVAYA